jgi:hypothetical protein
VAPFLLPNLPDEISLLRRQPPTQPGSRRDQGDQHPESRGALPVQHSGSGPLVQDNTGAQDVGDSHTATHQDQNGWVIVLSCAVMNFFFTGFSGSWGVLQAALLAASPDSLHASACTFSWIGSLPLALTVGFGLVGVHLLPVLGAQKVAILGELLFVIGIILSGFTTENISGLFVTSEPCWRWSELPVHDHQQHPYAVLQWESAHPRERWLPHATAIQADDLMSFVGFATWRIRL